MSSFSSFNINCYPHYFNTGVPFAILYALCRPIFIHFYRHLVVIPLLVFQRKGALGINGITKIPILFSVRRQKKTLLKNYEHQLYPKPR